MVAEQIDPDQIRLLFDYDPSTGVFVRLNTNHHRKHVGTLTPFGHRQIRVDGVLTMAHRMAWAYVYGEWPPTNLDHINGKPDDNRIENLRLATPKQNQENVKLRTDNSSGVRGVNWNARMKQWAVRVQHHKERIFIGYFRTLEDARLAAKTNRDTLYTHNKTEYSS